jgi:hypothetical protein
LESFEKPGLGTCLGLRARSHGALAGTALARKQEQSARDEQITSIHIHIH